ncbi:MAG TPA: SUMF1/EgtB/PvdO family nonheme iron enzyme, partial [Methylomirabilota bacterium]|nr:SUMF1/EgtB/PvdO family nonheme iron enzyme [Methylomirabilota bacterium]
MGARWITSGRLSLILCLTTVFGAHTSFAQPRLAIRVSSGAAELRVQGIEGTRSHFQWNNICGSSNWITFTNRLSMSNQLLTVVHPGVMNTPQRFYRVLASEPPPTNPHPEELVWIPPGTFLLGSPTNDPDRYSNEGPQTQVMLTRGFWMGRHEVTQIEYGNVTGIWPSQYISFYRPVDTVTWF